MSLIIQTNLPMINTLNKYKTTADNKTKSAEKLSSGYRINRAADDAAGLAISEKLRNMIRGLDRGTDNAQDGVSWVQIGDGALGEIQSVLHRMKEITIQSLNDTNTPEDRAALQAEFDSLQSEIDNISQNARFNTKNIFSGHESTYYQYEGNRIWEQNQNHVIVSPDNDLVIEYRKDENSPIETLTITVPEGVYTTQELTDEIDNTIEEAGITDPDIVIEYTKDGTFNINLEGGEYIENVSGGMSYLLYETYSGGSVGSLVGTTAYVDGYPLTINSENNNMSFTIENFDGVQTTKSITLPDGNYTKEEIIDMLNGALSDTSISAVEYGTAIKLTSNDSIITGFKGNMFKIDGGDDSYTSVFYDNVKYGYINATSGTFTGGAVLPTDSRDEEHRYYIIDGSNNSLTFYPDKSTEGVTITIPDGTYTSESMAAKLNELFSDADLGFKAESYTSGSYKGIKITSLFKGSSSSVGVDSSGSAYSTLFVNRSYNYYTSDASVYNETTADRYATFTGSKSLTGSNVPLVITQGVNDKFLLNINGTEYTITLNSGTYNDANAVKTAIDNELNGSQALAGYKDKVTVSVYSGCIRLTANDPSDTSISAKGVSGNSGYDNIFVGKNVTTTTTTVSNTGSSTTPPQITLNTPIDDPTSIDSSNNKLTISVNGVNKTVTLPQGSAVTHDQITEAIESQLAGSTVVTNNTFSTVSKTGSTTSNNAAWSGSGSTSYTRTSDYTSVGSHKNIEGTTMPVENNPAKVTVDAVIPDSMAIDNSNNQFKITINGETRLLTIDNGTYSRTALKDQLQAKINDAFGTYAGGAKVSIDSSGKLVFEARLEKADGSVLPGGNTSITISPTDSSFFKELHTVETQASLTTRSMNSSINITGSNNVFSFTYTKDGVTSNVSLTLDEGTYTRSGFADQINSKLAEKGIGVSAALSGSALKLTVDKAGAGTSIQYSTSTGGSSAEAAFGPLVTNSPATGTVNLDTQSSITIDGDSDKFNITVNNQVYNLTLDHGTYTRSGFINMLNSKFTENGVPVTASLSGNKITYTTTNKGSSASFSIGYSSGGNSMKAIYGTTTTTNPGVTAEFTSDNKLKLTGTENGGTLSVSSSNGGSFQTPQTTVSNVSPSSTTGYKSSNHAYIDGVNISEPVNIDNWNNELKFTYNYPGGSSQISITIPDNSYTFSELADVLQAEIDNQAGTGQLKVTVGSSGVRIEAVNTGSLYSMPKSSFSGDFYYKVLCSTSERNVNTSVSKSNGTQSTDTAYTIGRKDVKNNSVEIKEGINDELTFDFTYGNVTHKIELELDPGVYKGASLVDMIQKKLDEALLDMGLKAGTIEVGIGGINSGVSGANDANALNFKLSESVPLPCDGEYIIDGVGGNSAFYIFYQTDGEMINAYVKGSKDISEVTIEPGENELSFDVDGTTYNIQIPEGTYTSDEIIDELNTQLRNSGAKVAAEIEDNVLKLVYKQMGDHTISNISGSAKKNLFYQENSGKDESKDIFIQLSNNSNDSTDIERPLLNTCFLKINSITISKPVYANKSLQRIDDALDSVSEIRSAFGAKQNRLEHSMRGNLNNAENTQAAESRIRDTDMAKEMMNLSKQNILEQAAQAIMAQANESAKSVLMLLQ